MSQLSHRCTVVAVFDEPARADRALDELVQAGFLPEEVGRIGGSYDGMGPCGCITDWSDPPEGHVAIAVYAPERYSEALAILQQVGAIDLDRLETDHMEVAADYYFG
jgi:hypothetical protein